MPVDYRKPNINARLLGDYLRQLRETLELSYEEAAALLRCESDWLVRVETGFEWPVPGEVNRMLERYQVRQARIADVILDLASRPAGPPWLAAHVDRMKASDRDVLIMESEASIVRSYGVLMVPALAQSETYFRHIAPHLLRYEDCDVDVEWDLLGDRQRYRAGGRRRTLDVIIDMGALTRPLKESAVMVAQLRHLLELGANPGRYGTGGPRGRPVV